MKINDLLLYGSIIGIFFLSIIFISFSERTGAFLKVHVDKELIGEYELNKDNVVKITGADSYELTLIINDGKAKVIDATCPDKLCEGYGTISKTNESIICLPGRVVISVEADEESEYDAISR